MAESFLRLDSLALEPGMELGENIFNEQGILVLGKGTVLDQKTIGRLIFHDVKNIAIKKGTIDSQKLKLFTYLYNEKTDLVQHRLSNIKEGKLLNREQLYNISKDLIRALGEPRDVFKYLRALKLSDHSLYTHSLNVSLICNLFADWFKFPEELKKDLAVAGLLHDIGKIVSETEYESHPQLGYSLLAAQGAVKAIQMGVLMHHEKEDGSGFPTKSQWGNIHPFAKIISLSNYYDRVTTGGEHLQEKVCPFHLIKILEENRYGQFDIKYVDMFLNKIAVYHLGELVKLSDGRVAKVVFINKHHLSRPIVQLGEELIDLYWRKELAILELA